MERNALVILIVAALLSLGLGFYGVKTESLDMPVAYGLLGLSGILTILTGIGLYLQSVNQP